MPRQRLQLVGVTAMHVACKFEEIFPPEVQDWEYICDRAYEVSVTQQKQRREKDHGQQLSPGAVLGVGELAFTVGTG